MVVGSKRFGNEARVGELVRVARLDEADRECLHGLARCSAPSGRRSRSSRCRRSASRRGDVAHQASAHGVLELVDKALAQLGLVEAIATGDGFGYVQ